MLVVQPLLDPGSDSFPVLANFPLNVTLVIMEVPGLFAQALLGLNLMSLLQVDYR